MNRNSKINHILPYLPEKLGTLTRKNEILEIRMRVGRAVGIVYKEGEQSSNCILSAQEMEKCFQSVCDYSLHSFSKGISRGFITLSGGNRVGFCGTYSGETIKYISSMNFRIAGEIIGCSEEISNRIASPKSILIAGKPSCGKTTILRDLCRIIGKNHKISLIDERHEIAACYKGEPQNNIGKKTDVFDGYDKADGINKAIRVMSPEIIVCDEIGLEDDINAIRRAAASGIKFIASVHADNEDDIPFKNIFDYIVLLKNIGEINKIIKIG